MNAPESNNQDNETTLCTSVLQQTGQIAFLERMCHTLLGQLILLAEDDTRAARLERLINYTSHDLQYDPQPTHHEQPYLDAGVKSAAENLRQHFHCALKGIRANSHSQQPPK